MPGSPRECGRGVAVIESESGRMAVVGVVEGHGDGDGDGWEGGRDGDDGGCDGGTTETMPS